MINRQFSRLLLGEKPIRFSCERRHDLAFFAHPSPLLKAINPSQTARLLQAKKETFHHFSSNGWWNKSRKENRHFKTPFTVLKHLPWSPKIDFNSATRLQCLIRVQVHVLENTKRSFFALRHSILLLLFFLTFYLELCRNLKIPQFKEEENMSWKIRTDALVTQFPSFNNLG